MSVELVSDPIDPECVVLRDELARFAHDGYLVVDGPVVGDADVAEVRALVDELFGRFADLTSGMAASTDPIAAREGQARPPR